MHAYAHNHKEVLVNRCQCMCVHLYVEERKNKEGHSCHTFSSLSMHMYIYSVCARSARLRVYGLIHEHASGTAADLADFADISFARAAPLTFPWCQINLDLARCHIHLGTHL